MQKEGKASLEKGKMLKEMDKESEEKLKALHKVLKEHENERIRGDDNLNNLFKTHDLMQQDPEKAHYYQKMLKGMYNTARDDTEREISYVRKALRIIHDVRATRYANLTEKSEIEKPAEKPKQTMSKIALMKLMRQNASTLPLWIGRSDESPPPLCGAVPAAPDYVAKVGDMVAALVRVAHDEENWILAEVTAYDQDTCLYRVDDIDRTAQEIQHVLSRDQVIPLPLMKANPEDNPEAIFPKKACVLALYPQTTCFYSAVVYEPPVKPQDPYRLLFEDDEYKCGYSKPMCVHQRYVLNFRDSKNI